MSGSVATSPSMPFPAPIRLPERDTFRGFLHDIIEPDGEDIALALIEDAMIEVPRCLAPELWELVGQKVIIGHFDGQFRAGVSHT